MLRITALSLFAWNKWQQFTASETSRWLKCHQCWAALRGRIPSIYPREMGKRPRTRRHKSRKRWCCEQKLCWEDECWLWPFPSFLCGPCWEFISALPAAVVRNIFCYLEQAGAEITVCSLYRKLGAHVLVHWPECKIYTCALVLNYAVISVFVSYNETDVFFRSAHWLAAACQRDSYSCYGGGVNQSCFFSLWLCKSVSVHVVADECLSLFLRLRIARLMSKWLL